MTLYQYKAAKADDEIIEGVMEAADSEQVVKHLQQLGYLPIRVEPALSLFGFRPSLRGKGIGSHEIEIFTRELATLLEAGLPLDRSLQLLLDLSADVRMTQLCNNVLDRVRSGASLSDALEAQQGVFSGLYINMIRAGELGGSLASVLKRLSLYLERSKELRESIISALIYPAILVTVSVLSILILLTFVVPYFTELFADAGRTLPLSTQLVVGSAEMLQSYWWLLLLLCMFTIGWLRRDYQSQMGRIRWDGWFLRLPLVGDLIRKLETARFCHTLGTLLGNGVPLITALQIVKETLNNRAMTLALNEVTQGLKRGQGIAEPLLHTDIFPRLGVQMIKVGEETGALEHMLLQVADIYDQEVRLAVKRMLTLLEPLLIIALGVSIAFIIVSILLAIVSVNELAF